MTALVIVSIFTFFGSLLLFRITNFIIPLRVSESNERIGLDISQHNESIDNSKADPIGLLGMIGEPAVAQRRKIS